MIIEWLLKYARRRPHSPIWGDDGSLYMQRWWLFNPYDADGNRKYWWCPWSIRLHFILRPDADRELHDHPWNARSIILRGWYEEERDWEPADVVQPPDYIARLIYRRKQGDTYKIKFGEFHRISRVCPDGCLTLFITGPKRGEWGFMRNGVKVPYRDRK